MTKGVTNFRADMEGTLFFASGAGLYMNDGLQQAPH